MKARRTPVDARVVAVEGAWAVRHAVAARVPIEAVFVCPALWRGGEATELAARLHGQGVMVLDVSERLFRRMADRDGPDGTAAIARLPALRLDDLRLRSDALVVVSTGVDLVGNLGGLIRCADAAGADAVVIVERAQVRTHPQVVRASVGTVFSMPSVTATAAETVAWLRRSSFRLIGADPEAPAYYRDTDYRGRVAVLVGPERRGLAEEWRDEADVLVRIPMLGTADSLNVTVAAAVVLYEVVDQRRRQPGTWSASAAAPRRR